MTASHLPVIHPNGTPKRMLMDALSDAYDAIQTALEKLRRCAPNGRDYYVSADPNAFTIAGEMHRSRMIVLSDLMTALEEDMIAIDQSA